ncbi:hypothetical protein V8F20_001896 [Naviculisporaceae sp. PSN 640]
MAVQLLLLGATGHIGGAVLDDLLTSHPEVKVIAQVRSEKDSATLKAQYPSKLQTLVGSYNDAALSAAVGASSIVINAGPDATNEENIRALLTTLAGSIATDKPKFYIGTTGAALIWGSPDGNSEARTWDDVADIDDILALQNVTHATSDHIVQSANKLSPLLHTALVSPTFVSGISPSRKRPTPLIFPDWLHVIETLGAGVTINGGRNVTTFVEVKKLARLYVHLVEDALERLSSPSSSAAPDGLFLETWGPKAYYFAASLEIPFHALTADILLPALKKHGASYMTGEEGPKITDLSSTKPAAELIAKRHVGEPGAEIWSAHIAEGFGINMRVRGSRAEKAFGLKGFRWVDGSDTIVFSKEAGNDADLEESVRVFLKLEGKAEPE